MKARGSAAVILGLASYLAPSSAAAQTSPALTGLCTEIMAKTRAAPESGFRWEYERIILEAAKVPASAKNQTEQLQPVRDYWIANNGAFRCTSTNFDQVGGNALKYAIATGTYNMVNSAAAVWKLDLNIVSDGSGETLLDYLLTRLWSNHGNSTASQLQLLYRTMRNQGMAKFSCEVGMPNSGKLSRISRDPVRAAGPIWDEYRRVCKLG